MTDVLRSESIANVAKALAMAQGQMDVPQKRRTASVRMREEKGGGTYTYQYADLSDIRAAVVPSLAKNGLAISQMINADTVRLTTLLLHESGEFLGCTYDLPRGLPAQQFGSALTYARRYSLCSLLGVVAEDDDDASMAQGYTERNAKNKKTSGPLGPTKVVAVKPNQVQGGTSKPEAPHCPANISRDEVMIQLKQNHAMFMKLFPNEDTSSMIFERYGAQKSVDMTTDEAYEFNNYLISRLQKGVAV